MMWGSETGMGWWMVIGSIWFVVFWALIIWGVIKIAAGGADRGSDQQVGVPPLDIAKRRYASGEITRDEFERIRRDIET